MTNEEVIAALGRPPVATELSYASNLKGLRDRLVALFPSIGPFIDLESEPARKVLEVFAYYLTLTQGRINDAALASNSHLFATGATLDYHAHFWGVQRLSGETDVRLRERISLAVRSPFTGGTADRYRFVAMSVSAEIVDVVVWADLPNPRVNVAVQVAVGPAGPALLTAVADALNDPRVRMVNDAINVLSASSQAASITADVWLTPDAAEGLFATLADGLKQAWAATARIGTDLTLSWITKQLMQPGVQDVKIIAPTQNLVVDSHSAVSVGTVTLNYKGRAY